MKLVRALYDFVTDVPNEINLKQGDIIVVTATISANWLKGRCNNQEGNFPSNFVENVMVPKLQEGQKLFVGIEDFLATETGDLEFKKGEIIIGLRKLDANWWQGRSCDKGNCGIVPLTHVVPLPLPDSLDCRAQDVAHNVHGKHSDTGAVGTVFQVRAQLDSAAQLHEELSFRKGDVIAVTRVVDDDWYFGECGGKSGMFLCSLVEPLQTPSNVTAGTSATAPSSKELGQGRSRGDSSAATVVQCQAVYAFAGMHDSKLSFSVGDLITDVSRVDDAWCKGTLGTKSGLFPASYVRFLKSDGEVATAKSYVVTFDASRQGSPPAAVAPLGRAAVALHPFHAEVANEVTVARGDSLVVLRELGDGWCEVVVCSSGARGLCPVAYISHAVENISLVPPVPSVQVAAATMSRSQITRSLSSSLSGLDELVAHEMVKLKTKPSPLPRPASLVAAQSMARTSFRDRSEPFRETGKTQIQAVQSETAAAATSCATPSMAVTGVLVSPSIDSDDAAVAVDAVEVPAVSQQTNCLPATVTPSDCERDDDLVPLADGAASSADAAQVAPLSLVIPPSQFAAEKPIESVQLHNGGEAAAALQPLFQLPASSADIHTSEELPKESASKGLEGAPSSPQPATPASPQEPGSAGAALRPKRPVPPPPLHRSSSAAKLVPMRSVPPVPQSKRMSAAPILENLAVAASDKSAEMQHTEVADVHAIKDLQDKITLLEDDIKKLTSLMEETTENEESAPADVLQETVEFYISNINGMTEEVNELRKHLSRLQKPATLMESSGSDRMEGVVPQQQSSVSEEQVLALRKSKMKEQRQKVIDELKTTEESYLRDLQLCLHYFLSPEMERHPDVDTDTLFGNLEEVAAVSQKLLTSFENSVSNLTFENQIAGRPFVELSEDMKKVYAVYCRNHDDVCVLLEKYEEDESIQAYFNRVLDKLRAETVVFDVGSFLIKPVQRILKYPLLLNELIKCTEDSHPDKTTLKLAVSAVTDVASAINEYKRRKDLVYKYRKEKYATLTDKMALINMHTLKKKSARLGSRLANTLGLNRQARDLNFEKEEATFRNLERTMKAFVKNVVGHLQLLEKSVAAQEQLAISVNDLYDGRPFDHVTAYIRTQEMLAGDIFKGLKETVEKRVVYPLNKLLASYQGPMKVIDKRGDKLIDYENCQYSYERSKDSDQAKAAKDELQVAKKDYEALSEQLLMELPVLNRLSSAMLADAIGSFLQGYRKYIGDLLDVMYPLLKMPKLSTQGRSIMECFNADYDGIAAIVADLCSSSSVPTANSKPSLASSLSAPIQTAGLGSVGLKRASSASAHESAIVPAAASAKKGVKKAQTEEERNRLRLTYSPERLYRVVGDYPPLASSAANLSSGAGGQMDIVVRHDELVAVLKTKDPMGDGSKWFVDNGVEKGFMHREHLQPATIATQTASRVSVHLADVSLQPSSGARLSIASGQTSSSSRPLSLCDGNPSSGSPLSSPLLSGNRRDSAPVNASIDVRGPSQNVLSDDFLRVQQTTNSQSESRCNSTSEPSFQLSFQTPPPEYWYALYSFGSRSNNEASLVGGQPVNVLQKHDANGNTDWWLVECAGTSGYAPSNYLASYKPPEALAAPH